MVSDRLVRVDDPKLSARIGRSWFNSKHTDGIAQTRLFKMERLSDEEEKSYDFPWYTIFAIKVMVAETGKVYIAMFSHGISMESIWTLYRLKRDKNGKTTQES